jgi:hypothetical protein
MSESEQEVKLKIKGILGVSSPFYQGGSIRLTVPKRAVTKLKMQDKIGKEFYSMIFMETDKGMLVLPLDKVVRPDNIRDALKFIDLSGLSDEDLRVLFEEES